MDTINSLPLSTILHGKSYSYIIQNVLGQGTFGITYLAEVKMQGALGSIDSNVKVAVKEFFMHEINGREGTTVTSGSQGGVFYDYKKKFAREAQNLGKLQHTNIIKVMEFFEENNTYYYVMEYIDGGSLDDYITKCSRITEQEVIAFTKQICSALSFMHKNKMLHLDLKPANIMLRKDGAPVLIDFGLSKNYNKNGEPESSSTVGQGTPGYAPLEQATYHDGHGFPVTMDVYALGATMFKMLTGKRAPAASDILNDGFPKNELEKLNVSTHVISQIVKAMMPLKKDRHQSVTDFLTSLERSKEQLRKYTPKVFDGHCELCDSYLITDIINSRTNSDAIGGRNVNQSCSFFISDAKGAQVRTLYDCMAYGNYLSQSPEEGHIKEYISNYFIKANSEILKYNYAKNEKRQVSLAVLFITKKFAYAAHVGNCRIYQIRSGKVLMRTSDHTLVNDLVKIGELTEEDAMIHPSRHILTRAIGKDENIEVEISQIKYKKGDRFILCTDGVHGVLSDNALIKYSSNREVTCQQAVNTIIDKIKDSSTKSNEIYDCATLCLIEMHKDSETIDIDINKDVNAIARPIRKDKSEKVGLSFLGILIGLFYPVFWLWVLWTDNYHYPFSMLYVWPLSIILWLIISISFIASDKKNECSVFDKTFPYTSWFCILMETLAILHIEGYIA